MDKEEVKIETDIDFAITRQYLETELKDIIEGNATFIEMDEVERRLSQLPTTNTK